MEKAIFCVIQDDDETEKRVEADDDFNIEQLELKIWSSQAVFSNVDNLNSFCETLGNAYLVSALNLITRRLEMLSLKCLLNISHIKIVIRVSCIYLMTY